MIDYYRIIADTDISKMLSGNGEKGLLIVIGLPETENPVFSKLKEVIAAIRYDMARDTWLLALAPEQSIPIYSLTGISKVDSILCFGIHNQLQTENLNIHPYQKIKLNEVNLFPVETLESIMGNNQKKMQLWQLLKENFL